MTDPSPHAQLDHLIVAGPSLAEATEYVEALLGLPATAGGRHPGVGTHNALVGLGRGAYLEIIGPDPGQPDPALPRWFGMDDLDGPRLVTWCARTPVLEKARVAARTAGVDLGEISAGSRVRPDGTELRWRITDPRADRFHGTFPFLIDWGRSTHPSEDLEPAGACVALRGRHPLPAQAEGAVRALGLPLELDRGPTPRLEADIRTPRGLVTLR